MLWLFQATTLRYEQCGTQEILQRVLYDGTKVRTATATTATGNTMGDTLQSQHTSKQNKQQGQTTMWYCMKPAVPEPYVRSIFGSNAYAKSFDPDSKTNGREPKRYTNIGIIVCHEPENAIRISNETPKGMTFTVCRRRGRDWGS